MSRQKARGSSYVDSVQYEEPNSSQVSSIYYEQPEVEEDSETEQDVYDYTSPAPVEYEVPDNASDTAPEVPERGPHIITKPPAHPPPILHQSDDSDDEEEEGQNYDNHTSASRKVYTMLTHVHMPLIYSTPSHSMEFRANTAINNSSLDIVNLDSAPSSSSPAPPPPPPSHMDNGPHFLPDSRGAKSPVSHRRSRAKAAIMVFLLAAVVIGIVSLIVSVVAVFVTGDTGSTSDSAEALTVESLQEEVQLLQSEVEQMRNRTTGSVNISSFYENCETESKIERCTPEEGLGIEFSCITDELTLDKEVCSGLQNILSTWRDSPSVCTYNPKPFVHMFVNPSLYKR